MALKEIEFANVQELENEINEMRKTDCLIIPHDIPLRLSKGYIYMKDINDHDGAIHYIAPIHDNTQSCTKIYYDNKQTWLNKQKELVEAGNDLMPCDVPNEYMIGFSTYPEKEAHLLPMRLVYNKELND